MDLSSGNPALEHEFQPLVWSVCPETCGTVSSFLSCTQGSVFAAASRPLSLFWPALHLPVLNLVHLVQYGVVPGEGWKGACGSGGLVSGLLASCSAKDIGTNASLCPYGEAQTWTHDSQTRPLKRTGCAPTWRKYNGT